MRLPVLLIAAVAVAIAYALSGDVSARPIWAPTIDNPYCAITTYVLPDLTEQAMSTTDADDHPVIVINGLTVRQEHAYAEFLMAHECFVNAGHNGSGARTRSRQHDSRSSC